jgi:hypothetical protein
MQTSPPVQSSLSEAVLDHNQRFEDAHQRVRAALEAALALAHPAAEPGPAPLNTPPLDPAPLEHVRRRFERSFDPLTREEPQQAAALLVVGEYLIMLRSRLLASTARSQPEHEPARPPHAADVSSMHELLFGYRPHDDESRWCLPTHETIEHGDYEDYFDFLQIKQVRRMLTSFAATIAHLRRCPDPLAELNALENISAGNRPAHYHGRSPHNGPVRREDDTAGDQR